MRPKCNVCSTDVADRVTKACKDLYSEVGTTKYERMHGLALCYL